MNRIKGLLIVLILGLSFSSTALGSEVTNQETEVGIGFAQSDTEEPIIVRPNNVIPLTTEKDYVQATGRYPKTGEKGQSKLLQFIGALCIAGVFWLFLLLRFKDEDEEEDEAYESII